MEPTIQQLPKSTHTLVVSYLGVRRAIGVIGLLLPIVLGPVGWLVFGIEIQDNMSSYYHTPLRDVFVGSMCAIGVAVHRCSCGYPPPSQGKSLVRSRENGDLAAHTVIPSTARPNGLAGKVRQ